jgi:bleomycin hydrolase
MKIFKSVLLVTALHFSYMVSAQDTLSFEKIVQLDANPVESQGKTGTCWSFSTSSFLESELIRTKKGQHNLSEIFIARQVYVRKSENFVGRHGKAQFGEGSLAHDEINAIDRFGIVPSEVFDGLQQNSETHNHAELAYVLQGFLNAIVRNKGGKLSPVWKDAYSALLDVYLGEYPEKFTYEGQSYTPISFAESLGIKKENYITLTSYSHYPIYSNFVLEIPDNWDNGSFYNVSLDELVKLTKDAVKEGYTLVWDADVSSDGFDSEEGIAIVPEKDSSLNFETTSPEMDVTPEIRQENYDNYTVDDDHLMHIVGLAKGIDGKEYFIVKNSWGDERGLEGFEGHVLVSIAYFKMNTISVMLHKDGVSKNTKSNLKIN